MNCQIGHVEVEGIDHDVPEEEETMLRYSGTVHLRGLTEILDS